MKMPLRSQMRSALSALWADALMKKLVNNWRRPPAAGRGDSPPAQPVSVFSLDEHRLEKWVFFHLGVTSLRARRNPRCNSDTERERRERKVWGGGLQLVSGGPRLRSERVNSITRCWPKIYANFTSTQDVNSLANVNLQNLKFVVAEESFCRCLSLKDTVTATEAANIYHFLWFSLQFHLKKQAVVLMS